MTQQLQDAIDRFTAAVDAFAKRQAAIDIGAAIGGAIGYPLVKTATQIEAMADTEQTAWVASIESNPPEMPEGPPV